MHILDKIVAHKKKEVEQQKASMSFYQLEQQVYFKQKPPSMKAAILSVAEGGVIAEFKKKSPSKQDINLSADPSSIVSGYAEAGAAGISVLTDTHFFGGGTDDFQYAKRSTTLPLLRKDFMIDEYQLIEAKAMGAAVILLIARILTKQEMKIYTQVAHDLGMEVLVEIHNQEELDNCPVDMDLIGVNNRNLNTFEVDYENSVRLKNQLPESLCKISESGIHSVETMVMLRKEGFDGFLIGERFMKESKPEEACKNFLSDYRIKIGTQS